MELIETEQEKNQGPLPEPEPRYQTTTLPVERTEHGQAWVRLAATLVLAAILIVLIVLLARWIYHKAHNNASPETPTSQNTPAISANNPPAKSSSNSATSRPSGSSSSSSTSTTTNNNSSGTSNTTANPSQITNTGPGDVAAIFVGASLVAGGLHYLITARRFARNS